MKRAVTMAVALVLATLVAGAAVAQMGQGPQGAMGPGQMTEQMGKMMEMMTQMHEQMKQMHERMGSMMGQMHGMMTEHQGMMRQLCSGATGGPTLKP